MKSLVLKHKACYFCFFTFKFQKVLSSPIKFIITSPPIIYATRCVLGFLIGYELYIRFPEYELMWTLISIILVISPEGKDSRRLSIERFKSNLIGSIVGLFCLLLHAPTFSITILGILATIGICYIFKIMNMARVALVALLIIMVQPHFEQAEIAPFARIISVTLGCFIGLFITVLTSMGIRILKRRYNIPLS